LLSLGFSFFQGHVIAKHNNAVVQKRNIKRSSKLNKVKKVLKKNKASRKKFFNRFKKIVKKKSKIIKGKKKVSPSRARAVSPSRVSYAPLDNAAYQALMGRLNFGGLDQGPAYIRNAVRLVREAQEQNRRANRNGNQGGWGTDEAIMNVNDNLIFNQVNARINPFQLVIRNESLYLSNGDMLPNRGWYSAGQARLRCLDVIEDFEARGVITHERAELFRTVLPYYLVQGNASNDALSNFSKLVTLLDAGGDLFVRPELRNNFNERWEMIFEHLFFEISKGHYYDSNPLDREPTDAELLVNAQAHRNDRGYKTCGFGFAKQVAVCMKAFFVQPPRTNVLVELEDKCVQRLAFLENPANGLNLHGTANDMQRYNRYISDMQTWIQANGGDVNDSNIRTYLDYYWGVQMGVIF